MKRKLLILFFAVALFQGYAHNKISLNEGQKSLITIPETLQQNYTLSEFREAVKFNGENSDGNLRGIYCIFKDYSYLKPDLSHSNKKNKYLSNMIYIFPDGKNFTDILYISENESYSLEPGIKYEHEREYIKFDDSGRIFINSAKKTEGLSGILMYSPDSNDKRFFALPKEYNKVEDFAVSKDGKFLIVTGSNGNTSRSTQAFLFYTDEEFNSPVSLLYLNASKVSSIVYNPQNESFYVIASFFDPALESDEAGKICVLRNLNILSQVPSVEYYSQRDIENGKSLDFWDNLFVIDQFDNRIYAASNLGITYPVDGILHELIDNGNSLKLKLVEETADIRFHSPDYNGNGRSLRSTPLGLYIKDKNSKVYLLKDNKLNEIPENNFYQKLSDYNQKLFTQSNTMSQDAKYKAVIKENDQKIFELQKKEKLLIVSLIILLIIIFALIIVLLVVLTHRKILIRKITQKKILELQESERAKLSRDIHDSVVQDIRAIRLQTGLIETGDNQKAQQQKERVIEDITQTIVKMRNICYNLTPAELVTHQDGDSAKIELISVLDSLCQQFYVKTKIPCSLQIDSELVYPEYDKETSLHLVRVFQELLNNIEKHSYATNVTVLVRNKLEDNQNHLVIFVIDDGIGCNIQQCLKSRKKNHFGLHNIQERINLIGGKIEFFSSQNEGMKIKITVKM